MANVARVEATITAQNKLRPGLNSAARDLDKFRAAQTKATRAFAASSAQLKGMERMERVMGSLQRGAVALGGVYALQRAGQAIKEATVRFAEVDRAMTRTGITGDAMADEVRKGTAELRNLARDTATLFDPAQKGLDAITASGRDFGDAMKMMPSVLKTAQASGAGVDDIANSSTALIDHMKISIEGLAEAQDTLAMGGKLGKFELKDMARYLPSMLPAFKALGQSGQDGLRKLVAMLQVIRSGTGSAEEAASSAQNIFSKMESDQTVKNFKEMGVDLPKALAKARKEGKDLVEVFLELSNKALKGDLSKLPQLFQDMEVQRGMRPLLAEMQKRLDILDKLKGAKGTIDTDFKRIVEDRQSQIDQLKEGADRAKSAFGGLASEIGSPMIKAGAENLDAVAQALERATQAAKDGGLAGAVKQIAGELTDKVVKDVAEGRQNMADLQQRHDDDEKIAKWQEKGRGGMFDWLTGDSSRGATEASLAKLKAKEKRQGLSPLDRVKKRQLEDEIAGQENAWSRDQMRRVGLLPDQLSSSSPEFANMIESAREARRAAALSRGTPENGPLVAKGLAQRGGVLPPQRPGGTTIPAYADDAPRSGLKNDTAKLPQNPQGSAASNSLFSSEPLAGQTLDPKLTKTAAPGIGEITSKVEAAKTSVESLGSAGASAGSALASGITSGLSTMEAQVAASVARMQAQLDSLKAPSLSLGGLNTGKGMVEVR